ncbi:TPA: carbohydrate kinase family protein, partial [Candidatus Bathyarchaeota archaeon]|nr:carbohydrate kinase family protein [Candidatus Bathyarchaeota archaeon]
NFAIGVARIGGGVGCIGAVGSDQFGEFLLGVLEVNGVDVSRVKVKDARTSLAFVIRYPGGERSFFFYRKPWAETADTMLSPDDIDPHYVAKAKILHYSGMALSQSPCREAVLEAVRIAREAGVHVFLDPNIRPDVWADRDTLTRTYDQAMRNADSILFATDEVSYLFNTTDYRRAMETVMERYGPAYAIVKLGAKGCYIRTMGGEEILKPGFDVVPVDTTGAGDGWAAGFEEALIEGLSLDDCATIANAIGALVVTKMGAITALPTREELRSFLRSREVTIDF